MTKISPSILSCDFANLKSDIHNLNTTFFNGGTYEI